MSDIQAIIELIEKGRNSNEYGDGWGQVSTALAMLKKMQEDSHLHSGQRWVLSQILECKPLYKDIEKAVRRLKKKADARLDTMKRFVLEQQWIPIEFAPKGKVKARLARIEPDGRVMWSGDGRRSFGDKFGDRIRWVSLFDGTEMEHPTHWQPYLLVD